MSVFDDFYKGIKGDFGKKRFVKSDEFEEEIEDLPEETKSEIKNSWLYLVSALAFLLLAGRLWSLQIVQGRYLFDLAEGNRIRIQNIPASRGIIYDRYGTKLVQNIATFNVELKVEDLPKDKEEKELVFVKLEDVLGISKENLRDRVSAKKDSDPIVLLENIPREKALTLKEELTPCLRAKVVEHSTRSYSLGSYGLSHIFGYVGRVTEKDLENEKYLSTDLVGKTAIEAFYEDKLKGQNGKEQVEVDAFGRVKRILAKVEAEAGYNLTLSLDLELQKKTYEIIKAAVAKRKSPGGVAIVANPNNGEIYSLVSFPDFNINRFTTTQKGDLKSYYDSLVSDPALPMFNRAISGSYPPGSTIKPALAAAGLNEGTISSSTSLYTTGVIEVPNKYNPDIIYKFPDWKVHGWVDTRRAIAVSCDIFFYAVGGGHEHIEGLGVDRIREYYQKFGFGSKTGIDLLSEAKGLVPSNEWKKRVKGESWYQGDTYHISIGQGDLLVTPIQLLNMTAVIANGGELVVPHFVTRIVDSKGQIIKKIDKTVVRKDIVAPEHIKVVQQGMRMTVTSGTAKEFSSLPFTVAAKTGTAQFDNNAQTHTWLTAYAPYENPQVVIVVMLEGGQGERESARSPARQILSEFFALKL